MINYPVDVARDSFTFIIGEEIHRNKEWPRLDGMPLEEADPNMVVLQQFYDEDPNYDPETEKLDEGHWDDDPAREMTIFSRKATQLTENELAINAEKKDRVNKRVALKNAIPVLRGWADDAEGTTVTSGNAVNVLQTVVNRLGKFFDNFADMLEVQQIDK